MEKLPSIEEVIKKYTSEQALAMVLQDVLIKDRQNTRDILSDEERVKYVEGYLTITSDK